ASLEDKNLADEVINNQIPSGNIKFIQVSSENFIVRTTWTMTYIGYYDPQKFIIVDYEIIQSQLYVSITTKIDKLAFINSITSLDLTIFFNPSYELYGFISDSERGNIELLVYNLNFSIFDLKSNSGNVNARLDAINVHNDFKISTGSGEIILILDDIYFAKDFICTTISGYQNFDIWNIKFAGEAKFKVTSIIGRIFILWANHYLKSHILSIELESNNDIYLKMWSPKEIIRSYISFETIDGTTRLSKPAGIFQEIDENHYIANNINDTTADPCNITVFSKHGYGWVFYVDCFKWQRFCTYGDFTAYFVTKTGSYSILEADYNVTTIEVFNWKYIYLNTYRTIPLNIETLPISSENLVHVVWNLKYKHAQGIGVGGIRVGVTHSQDGDNLNVNINLKFILDQILPTFSICNVTVFYHPSYTFYNYTI
ncbi:MAG: hypothetical protein ACFFGP_12855, partial [Promethearchaeota archaeon]